MEAVRTLVDVGLETYLLGVENNNIDINTNDEKMKRRMEREFVRSSYELGCRLDELIYTLNKFITFEIEGIFKIRMLIPIEYNFYEGTYYSEQNAKDILKNLQIKSLSYDNTTLMYDNIVPVLNEIRKKYDTRYENTQKDFIVDFYENLYKAEVLNIIGTLINSHFEEAVVKKIGNSYSILYNDLDTFKSKNPDYDETRQYLAEIFLETTVDNSYLSNSGMRVNDIKFSELDRIEAFKILAKKYEDDFMPFIDNPDYTMLYYKVLGFQQSIDENKDIFNADIALKYLDYLNLTDDFVSKIWLIKDELFLNTEFLREVVRHYMSLRIFLKTYSSLERNLAEGNLNLES